MNDTVLVTGGAGFLGSHICDRLITRGARVLCLDDLSTGALQNVAHLAGHPRFELIRHDVIEPLSFDVQQIFHLACPASPPRCQHDPIRTLRTAVEGTRQALDLAHRAGARVLISSTSEVYGEPEQHPQRESYRGNVSTSGPRACYDEGKRCAEALAAAYARKHGVEVRVARIFNTYGPRMQVTDGRVVSTLLSQALSGAPLTVHGSGDQTRSFCYVDDLVLGLLRLMELDVDPGPINLGNPAEMTIRALAERVLAVTGSRAPVRYEPRREDDPSRRRPDISRARRLLSWTPAVSIDDGLRATAAHLRPLVTAPPDPYGAARERAKA